MKLFEDATLESPSMSMEQYLDYFYNTSHLSQEFLGDFGAKLKDLFSNVANSIYSTYNDKAVKDALKTKHQVIQKAKTLNYTMTSINPTSKPLNFKGYYLPYLDDLNKNANFYQSNIYTVLNKLKTIIGNYIINTTPDKDHIVIGISFFKDQEKTLKDYKESLTRYFPVDDGSVKTTFRNILRNYEEFPKIIESMLLLDNKIYPDNLRKIENEVQSCRQLIDNLIETTMKKNTFNSQYKKDIVYVTYTTAQIVEYVYFIYSNSFNFYSVFKNNTEDFLKL